uniref:Retrotransposon protein, putative, Ty3-gypsy subclass n=1 Tax=Oryza sativa subsp. japonica TaxID=39947 RepID=Q7XFN9_ORYSJ|nr:retrotransposon protein, putative, Ty3-gypsy subclass [Oryza sativa Japonica Group]
MPNNNVVAGMSRDKGRSGTPCGSVGVSGRWWWGCDDDEHGATEEKFVAALRMVETEMEAAARAVPVAVVVGVVVAMRELATARLVAKGYEEFKGTNLLVSIEFIGRLTNRSASKYKINANDVIENMHSKGITFMSPLKISSEERAGEEWKISDLIESKTLSQPENYISYQNSKRNTSIRFINYKPRTTDDLETEASDRNIIDNRRHSVSEFMEKLDQESEIKYYENKLKEINEEYNNSMKCEWTKIRDKELYFYKELARVKKVKKNEDMAVEIFKNQETKIEQIKRKEKDKYCKEEQNLGKILSEEEQWAENERLFLESYEEEINLINEMENIENEIDNAEQYNDFINTLDEVGLHNLDNAMEAMEVDLGTGKRKRYGEGTVKNEGERERPARAAGKWPPDREEFSYNYIPGQYRHMGTKRRDFEKPVKFQNKRSDGAILNLAAHDPIDWPNIISIWKGLIVQKYIQNQHNIGSKVEDMITYLETFLGESAKVLWEQWVEKNPNNYEELKRAGSNPHNFANVISNIIIAEDPELGYTTLQNERLKEIEKLTLTSWKGIKEFSQHYLYNATTAKQGYNRGTVERYFNKLPDPLGSMIFEEYKKETEGAEINISQAITFVFKQLRKICTGIQAQRSMKHSDYNFCNKIVQIPLSYGEDKPRSKRIYKHQNRNNNNIRIKKRFLQQSVQTTVIHEQGITFIPYQNNVPYISKPNRSNFEDIEEFKMHIEELLKLGAIRESRSPHRSAAFIVRNHVEEVRGKSRMIINYKRLNDNTIEDAYNIPNKQEWINRIQGSKYFSKFDLKAGFWQVKMAEESIEWTAFTCPQGHYEWLVMPLGLKNAPAIFQRKMQNIFNENQEFILVYIDDLLVFSRTYKEHIAHLEIFFRKVEQNRLILSKKKMEICKEKINFLGHEIGEGKIHLQEHIAKKILQFPDAMNDKKKLQQFLGLVNYARNHINNLAKLAGPLYAKLIKNDREIMAIINAINAFRLYLGFKELTVRTDCEAICRYYNQLNSKKSSTRRWVLFEDIITGNGYKVIFEHIKGKYNNLADMLSRLPELQKPIYVVFDGKLPGVYISFEEIVAQKIDAKLLGGISWKKYKDIDEALSQARKIVGINYYLEPAAKEYIQKCKKAKGKKTLEIPIKTTIKEEGYSKKPTYKECLTKGVDPLDGEYIDWKIIEKFEEASP